MGKYYDDALIAAYMAREFGVKVLIENPLWINDKNQDAYIWSDNWEYILNGNIRADISEDSLHIFEPQVGDLGYIAKAGVFHESNPPDRIYKLSETHMWRIGKDRMEHLGGRGVQRKTFKMVKIIQRNKKAFFMPKEEIE